MSKTLSLLGVVGFTLIMTGLGAGIGMVIMFTILTNLAKPTGEGSVVFYTIAAVTGTPVGAIVGFMLGLVLSTFGIARFSNPPQQISVSEILKQSFIGLLVGALVGAILEIIAFEVILLIHTLIPNIIIGAFIGVVIGSIIGLVNKSRRGVIFGIIIGALVGPFVRSSVAGIVNTFNLFLFGGVISGRLQTIIFQLIIGFMVGAIIGLIVELANIIKLSIVSEK